MVARRRVDPSGRLAVACGARRRQRRSGAVDVGGRVAGRGAKGEVGPGASCGAPVAAVQVCATEDPPGLAAGGRRRHCARPADIAVIDWSGRRRRHRGARERPAGVAPGRRRLGCGCGLRVRAPAGVRAPAEPRTVRAMPINPDAVGSTSEPHESSWNSKDCLLYALGVGAGVTDPTGFELEFTTENSQEVTQRVLPTFPVVVPGGAGAFAKIGTFNPAMLVHGEQSVGAARPPPCRRHGRVGHHHHRDLRQRVGRGDRQRDGRHGQGDRASRCGPRPVRRSSGARAAGAATAARPAASRSPNGTLTTPSPTPPDPTRRCSTASPATATRCTPTPSSPPWAGSTSRSCTGCAASGSPGGPSCTRCADRTRTVSCPWPARFSKPVFPGEELTVTMWVTGDGLGRVPDLHAGRGRHRRRPAHASGGRPAGSGGGRGRRPAAVTRVRFASLVRLSAWDADNCTRDTNCARRRPRRRVASVGVVRNGGNTHLGHDGLGHEHLGPVGPQRQGDGIRRPGRQHPPVAVVLQFDGREVVPLVLDRGDDHPVEPPFEDGHRGDEEIPRRGPARGGAGPRRQDGARPRVVR